MHDSAFRVMDWGSGSQETKSLRLETGASSLFVFPAPLVPPGLSVQCLMPTECRCTLGGHLSSLWRKGQLSHVVVGEGGSAGCQGCPSDPSELQFRGFQGFLCCRRGGRSVADVADLVAWPNPTADACRRSSGATLRSHPSRHNRKLGLSPDDRAYLKRCASHKRSGKTRQPTRGRGAAAKAL